MLRLKTGLLIVLFSVTLLLATVVESAANNTTLKQQSYQPQAGDLLFQDLHCGKLCSAITSVTIGYKGSHISHMGMIVSKHKPYEVIEAIGDDVHLTELSAFLNRSVNKQGKPRVIVGRFKPQYRHLIPQAIKQTKKWLGKPYNSGFIPDNHYQQFYCSQLIDDAFAKVNNGKSFFTKNKMNFEKNGAITPAWQAYFEKLHQKPPQGQPGTNPGAISRSPKINIIYNYGGIQFK